MENQPVPHKQMYIVEVICIGGALFCIAWLVHNLSPSLQAHVAPRIRFSGWILHTTAILVASAYTLAYVIFPTGRKAMPNQYFLHGNLFVLAILFVLYSHLWDTGPGIPTLIGGVFIAILLVMLAKLKIPKQEKTPQPNKEHKKTNDFLSGMKERMRRNRER